MTIPSLRQVDSLSLNQHNLSVDTSDLVILQMVCQYY